MKVTDAHGTTIEHFISPPMVKVNGEYIYPDEEGIYKLPAGKFVTSMQDGVLHFNEFNK